MQQNEHYIQSLKTIFVNPLAERILLDGTNFLCGILETVYSTNNNRNGLSLSGLTVRITLRGVDVLSCSVTTFY